ncbi:MAG: 23S rRNA methyltransferase [Gammaproteobacteria bacterium RIFCSPHIGHO2_12_FULL_35_23]|nr:MAG: 23S rRNA methyltransferase [Gammaproteobacteria bacterium RIFCSPHIGHO2_12_FULL_35_23]
MARSKSSRQWLSRHFEDDYVKKAQAEGWRSRAVFKLLEIQEKDQLIKPGMQIVDLGAAPGGWSQVAAKLLKGNGKVYALDILPMASIENVIFLQGDFREEIILTELLTQLEDRKLDLVMSDMAPNLSGQKYIDQPRSMYLAELALEFAERTLKPEGTFLIKVFQGYEFEAYLRNLRQVFEKVVIRKPKASRSSSKEVYLLAKIKREVK